MNDVTYDEGAGRLVIHASQHITYSVAQWVYPDRLAIDISGGVFLDRRKDVEIGTSSIRNIVVSQFDLRPNVTRILVHLNQKVAYVDRVDRPRAHAHGDVRRDRGPQSSPRPGRAAPSSRRRPPSSSIPATAAKTPGRSARPGCTRRT